MNHICNPLFRFKELLEAFLTLDDIKLRKLLSNLVRDMNKAIEEVDCLEDMDNLEIKTKDLNYII